MSNDRQSAGRPSDETLRFHRVVTDGDLEELRSAVRKGADVNAPGRVGTTALMLALASRDLAKVKLLVEHGADPELTDDFNATALRHAVDADFADGVRFLLSLGVDRGYHPRYPRKTIEYDYDFLDMEMSAELKEVMTEAEWQESLDERKRSMREMDQTVRPIISDVRSVEVLHLFLEAGDELSMAPTETKRALLGLKTGGEPNVSPDEYRKDKSPRYGNRNPQRMDCPFWRDMIRTGGHAYSARKRFDDPSTAPGVVWCYERFGSTLTELGDGRFVQIGGEHEDYYDPDFFIYNDVVIHDGQGDFEIYGYPRDIFPPTDFHTATLCPDGIYVIGCLGYMEQRQPGFTPVYRLTLESWRIEPVRTDGEMPGWIHEHRARFDAGRNVIRVTGGENHVIAESGKPKLVPNKQPFELDLDRLQWRRVD